MTGQKIIRSMERAAAAYREVIPVPVGAQQVLVSSFEDVQYVVQQKGEILKITFRGSNSRRDWKTNLTFWKKTIPYGNTASPIRVHAGFLSAYKSPEVREKIHSAVTEEIRYIQIAGHSQGAALAVLCAVDLEYNFPDRDIECVVFGCPRVGNRAFQESFNKRVFKTVRVENGNDIVTKVPFALWGYRHVGAKVHVGAPRIFGRMSCKDHYPHAYYSSLIGKLLGKG